MIGAAILFPGNPYLWARGSEPIIHIATVKKLPWCCCLCRNACVNKQSHLICGSCMFAMCTLPASNVLPVIWVIASIYIQPSLQLFGFCKNPLVHALFCYLLPPMHLQFMHHPIYLFDMCTWQKAFSIASTLPPQYSPLKSAGVKLQLRSIEAQKDNPLENFLAIGGCILRKTYFV